MRKIKQAMSRLLSGMLAVIMVVGMVPAMTVPAEAASNKNYKLTGNPTDDVIAVAVAQENLRWSDLGAEIKTACRCGDVAWCGHFVYWCGYKAGFVENGLYPSNKSFPYASDPALWLLKENKGTMYCYDKYYDSLLGRNSNTEPWKTYDKSGRLKKVGSDFKPEKGDIIIFGNPYGGAKKLSIYHTGYVREKSQGKEVKTVEGNTGTGVKLRTVVDAYTTWTGYGIPTNPDQRDIGYVVAYVRPNYCEHTNDYEKNTGYCTKCKTYKPNKDNEVDVKLGYYKTVKQAELHTQPYGVSDSLDTIKVNVKNVEVTGKVENGLGNNWFVVEYKSKTGYVAEDKLVYEGPGDTKITTTKLPVPENHVYVQGSGGVSLNFKLTATHGKIATVKGEFCYASGGTTVPNSVCGPYVINSTEYSAGGKALDTAMKFDSLPVGRFFYRITVTGLNDEPYEFKSEEFDVVAKEVAPEPAVEAPTIEYVRSYPGGMTYRITQHTDGATLTYWYHKASTENGGKNYTTTAKSVEINVEQTSSITACSTKNGKSAYYGGKPGAQLTVTVPELEPPVINITPNAQGAQVVITGNGTIRYSVDGSEYQLYTKPISISKRTSVIAAFVEKDGCQTSETAQATFTATLPGVPEVSLLGTASEVPVGTAIHVSWDEVPMAFNGYSVLVYLDGEQINSQPVKDTAFTVATEQAGVYTIQVKAENRFGSSAFSKAAKVTAHDPVTVTFKTDDGQVIGQPQKVRWGGDATAPAVPAKKGYTFKGWNGDMSGLYQDTTITAQYEINKYTVRFYGVNGTTYLDKQTVEYGKAVDDSEIIAEFNKDLGDGFVFAGWHISECDTDSAQDLTAIDSDMSLVATKMWGVKDLPIATTINSAARNWESTGYNVNVTLTCADPSALDGEVTKKAKVIATLKTADGRMLTSEMITVSLDANDLKSGEVIASNVDMFISYSGDYLADLVEVSVVGIDEHALSDGVRLNMTGGMLAKTKTFKPTVEVKWSKWMTADDLKDEGISITDANVQSKTQYSYIEKRRETTQVTNTSKTPTKAPEGYSYATTTKLEDWSAWSSWSDTPQTETEDRDVEEREVTVSAAYTEYRYGGYFTANNGHDCWCKKYLESKGWGSATLKYSPWSRTKYSVHDSGWTCGNCSGTHTGYYGSDGSRKFWNEYEVGGLSYYWEESRTFPEVKKTQYQYRDRLYRHTYEKWVVDKTQDWDDTPVQSLDTTDRKREVKTQTLYRYQTNDADPGSIVSPAVTRTSSGTLKAEQDLSGKLATVLVYKETNSDPTEPQIEYVGQTTIGANNSFSFSYQTKEEPSTATGDFIVALALQGASNVVNVDKVFSPDEEYAVTFYDFDGKILGEKQTVQAGKAATHVTPPEVEGYKFLCWDTDITCITHDVDVMAIYWPEEYSVVFVDHANETVDLRTDYTHGEQIASPNTPAYEGKSFKGWQVISNTTGEVIETDLVDFTVTDDLIVVAQWDAVKHIVSFMDNAGNLLKAQEVAHGEAAEPPAYTDVPENMQFMGWEQNNQWWNVTSDMSVYPMLTYLETTAAPASNTEPYFAGVYSEIELTAEEGATIYYTVDGSDPDPMRVIEGELTGEETAVTYIYTGPIQVDETTTIRAISVKANKNDSDVVYIDFVYNEEAEGRVDYYDGIEIGTYNVQAEAGNTVTLSFNIEENPGLIAYAFLIDADPSVFGIKYDEEAYEPMLSAGDVCAQNGTMLVGPYQEGIGWQVLWFGSEAAEGDGTLCTIELQVADEAETGTYPVVVSYSPANTISEEWFEQDVTKKVSVSAKGAAGLLGDVNSDGYITSIDVVRIARYIIDDMSFSKKEQKLADVTGDGNITAADVIRLARYIVGLAELG